MPENVDFILRFLIFASAHSLLAMPTLRKWLQSFTGKPLRWYRLAYNLLSLALFGWVMMGWPTTSVLYVVPGIWSLIMYVLQLTLLIAMLVCLRQTGMAAFLGTATSDESDTRLTTSGCYAVVRHPLYLLSILFFLLNPVMTTRWLTLTIIGSIYMVIGALIEERRLTAIHGAAYADYRSKVPFLLPLFQR